MFLTIRQEELSWNYKYKIKRGDQLLFKAVSKRRLIGIRGRRVTITGPSDEVVCEMAQQPFGGIAEHGTSPVLLQRGAYTLIQRGEKFGWIRGGHGLLMHESHAEIFGVSYKITWTTETGGNSFHFFRGEEPVGRIDHPTWVTGDGDLYEAHFEEKFDPLVVAIFALFVDLTWFVYDNGWGGYVYSKRFGIGGTKPKQIFPDSKEAPAKKSFSNKPDTHLWIGWFVGLLVLSLLVFGLTAAFHVNTKNFLEKAVQTTGTVVKLVPGSGESADVLFPLIEYTDTKGDVYYKQGTSGSYPPKHHIGQHFEILYSPRWPKNARIATTAGTWGGVIFGNALACFFLFGSFVSLMIHFLRRKKRQAKTNAARDLSSSAQKKETT